MTDVHTRMGRTLCDESNFQKGSNLMRKTPTKYGTGKNGSSKRVSDRARANDDSCRLLSSHYEFGPSCRIAFLVNLHGPRAESVMLCKPVVDVQCVS